MSEYSENTDVSGLDGDFDAPVNAKKTLVRLWIYLSDQYLRLAVVLFSVILYTLLAVLAPVYSASLVDTLWENIKAAHFQGRAFRISWHEGGRDLTVLLAMYLGSSFFYTLQSLLMASFAEDLSLRLRSEIGSKLNRLPLAYFDRTKPGSVLSRAVNDLDKASEALQTGMLKLLSAVGMLIGALIMMFRFSLLLTLIFLCFAGLALLATRFVSAQTLKWALRRQECMSEVTSHVEEAYSGRILIKAFNQEKASSLRMHRAAGELAEASLKTDFIINAVNPAIRLINRLGQILIAVFAGYMLLEGRLTVGVFQAFFQYINQASEPLTEMAYMINGMQSALASFERVYALLDEEEQSVLDSPSAEIHEARGLIEFRHVRSGYSPDAILMNDISFTAHPGQKIAIVGSTGAGKTTLINLLMRFYEVNGGAIFLDGVNTASVSRENLRSNFGMVLQDSWLFGATIAENIAYGKPDASRDEIIAAAQAARVDFFVRTMSHGYDTVLSNEAETVSAGQRQLLTIARVFLRNPAVIILDEATSSVDTRTEIAISRAMRDLMRGRTSFVIAHRLSTITDADLILFMKNGTIIEQGNHKTLLEAGGAYADLYYSQFA